MSESDPKCSHCGVKNYALAEEAFASRGVIESDLKSDSGCPCSGCLHLSASCLVLLLLAVLLFGVVIWFGQSPWQTLSRPPPLPALDAATVLSMMGEAWGNNSADD